MKKACLYSVVLCSTALLCAITVKEKTGNQSCEGDYADCQAEVGATHDESSHTTAIVNCSGKGAQCRARAN